jgi:hypothetical protein
MVKKKERYGQVASVDGNAPLGTVKVSIDEEDRLMRELASKEQPDGKVEIAHDSETNDLLDDIEELQRIDPYALGAQFLNHCIIKGWVVRRGSGRDTTFYLTEDGRATLATIFDIHL